MLNILENLELEEVNELKEKEKKFKVTDLSKANWTIRKLKALKKKEEEVKNLAAEEIERINEWKNKELSSIENSQNFFEIALREYYEKEKQKDKKFKLSTPYGTFYTRARTDKITIDKGKEEDLIRRYEGTDLVKVKKTIDTTALKKKIGENFIEKDGKLYDTETGEELEGVMIVKQDNTSVVVFK